MEWLESMLREEKQPGDEVPNVAANFYGEAAATSAAAQVPDTLPGAARQHDGSMSFRSANSTPVKSNAGTSAAERTPSTSDQKMLDAQKRAELLRAKLIANRQNTPVRANTPNKADNKPQTLQQTSVAKGEPKTSVSDGVIAEQKSEPPTMSVADVEQLVQEGKAAADAKAKAEEEARAKVASAKVPTRQSTQNEEVEHSTAQPMLTHVALNTESQQPAERNTQVTDLPTEYYADLAIWLEVTGYHDVQYRNSKLRTYRERQALEREAARIQEKLEQLRQAEQAEMGALRGAIHPAATPVRPPVLPPTLSGSTAASPVTKAASNGVKRAHSPEPRTDTKNARPREDTNNGIRIRGANASPQEYAEVRDLAEGGIDRRVSYPDAHRQGSFSDARGRRSRDPSLERRQAYYARDGDEARGRERTYDTYPPRDVGGRGGRIGYSAVNVAQERPYREPYPARGIRSVVTGRGDNVRYFMIKSWNADNVAAAMRDSLWSTQVKNEEMLAKAFHDSAAVVLCFSVNNSKAFQGYALMTSPPDPSLPKPAFCSKLNWPTSNAFTLEWLAMESVHFRHVGHIKNPLNLDDSGRPNAVLVGKDGQEIAPEAGRGLCEILDDVMNGGAPGGRRSGRGGG